MINVQYQFTEYFVALCKLRTVFSLSLSSACYRSKYVCAFAIAVNGFWCLALWKRATVMFFLLCAFRKSMLYCYFATKIHLNRVLAYTIWYIIFGIVCKRAFIFSLILFLCNFMWANALQNLCCCWCKVKVVPCSTGKFLHENYLITINWLHSNITTHAHQVWNIIKLNFNYNTHRIQSVFSNFHNSLLQYYTSLVLLIVSILWHT